VLAGAALGALAVLARRLRRCVKSARRALQQREAVRAAARRAASPPPSRDVSQQLETRDEAGELRALRLRRLQQ
jgi:hypothetical protein